MDTFFNGTNSEMDSGMNPGMNPGMGSGTNTGMGSGMNTGRGSEMNPGMGSGTNFGMETEMSPWRSRGMNPGMNFGMDAEMTPWMNRGMNSSPRNRFSSVTGIIVEMVPARMGNRVNNSCVTYMTLEDMDGNVMNFVVTPSTYVVDFETLSVGMRTTFWYRTDAPVPLVYPPQYNAVVAAQEINGRMVDVDFYNASLMNASQTLQLNMEGSVDVRTTNNQYFQGSPGNRNLVVIYETSTRSMPAQTTPKEIVVLCEQ